MAHEAHIIMQYQGTQSNVIHIIYKLCQSVCAQYENSIMFSFLFDAAHH
jgi:hypothetical protein